MADIALIEIMLSDYIQMENGIQRHIFENNFNFGDFCLSDRLGGAHNKTASQLAQQRWCFNSNIVQSAVM